MPPTNHEDAYSSTKGKGDELGSPARARAPRPTLVPHTPCSPAAGAPSTGASPHHPGEQGGVATCWLLSIGEPTTEDNPRPAPAPACRDGEADGAAGHLRGAAIPVKPAEQRQAGKRHHRQLKSPGVRLSLKLHKMVKHCPCWPPWPWGHPWRTAGCSGECALPPRGLMHGSDAAAQQAHWRW